MTNPLYSMTGFARLEGKHADDQWVWEVRAVNGKSLDIRLRLPPGFEILDPQIRKIVGKALSRGNLQISLGVHSAAQAGQYELDEDWLNSLIDSGNKLIKDKKVKRPRLDGMYNVRGVIREQIASAADPAYESRNAAILKSLEDLLDHLKSARAQEGDALAKMLRDIISALAKKTKQAEQSKGADANVIKAGFEGRFKALLSEQFSEDRLAQEAAVLAVKADVREELDRLTAHIAQARQLIKKGSPVGRKLDFLSQEFIREINTLCSKSTDTELTQIGLDMKSLIEQFREQAANVE